METQGLPIFSNGDIGVLTKLTIKYININSNSFDRYIGWTMYDKWCLPESVSMPISSFAKFTRAIMEGGVPCTSLMFPKEIDSESPLGLLF